tara:strand:- start:167 stop:844 length:678 start_codon:yes stop_codon:yes gene_type:complete
MKHTIILTAGGIGKRMGGKIPKQFLKINDTPILIYNLKNIYKFNNNFEIIITLPEEWVSYWKDLLKENDIDINHKIVNGGKERYHSIKNAINQSSGDTIAVHDGVRPLVSHDTLNRIYGAANKHHAIAPYIPINESIREKKGLKNRSKNREEVVIIQTPQCFKREVLIEAYKKPFKKTFTDDATLVESNGASIFLIEGNQENIKITSPKDIAVAEAIMNITITKK